MLGIARDYPILRMGFLEDRGAVKLLNKEVINFKETPAKWNTSLG
jgi:hypothetical protein